jgi:hypothetical protein
MNSYDVLAMRQVVYVFTQAVAAQVRLECMKVANQEREAHGWALAYDEAAFDSIIDEFGLGHNSVVATLNAVG